MKNVLLLLLSLLTISAIHAQNTVGLLSYNENQASEGYNLFFPHNQGNVYLIDNCGELVNVWEDFTYRPGNSVELDPNGNLYALKGRGQQSNPTFHAGGGGELLEVRDWDNNLLWDFVYNDSLVRLHHDMALMPSGNVLLLAWNKKSEQEAIDAGRDTALLAETLWPDEIVEVAPDGNGGGTVVWSWKAWDHLVQDYDPAKANYGVIADNPQLIDLNLAEDDNPDWMHSNAVDYNEFYDQIVISVPKFNEVWIIDHSTTTAQAASHTGGLSGKGGDLLFRWGNPAAYGAGTAADQKLFFQHDIHWVDLGLNSSSPDFLKLAVFNNRVGSDFSSVNLIAPIFDSYDTGYPMNNGVWEPGDFNWSYTKPTAQDMYSTGLSSLQILPNGNRLICVGRSGYSFEINADEEIVWEYETPLLSGNPVEQGETLVDAANNTFAMKRYAADFDGFVGKDLSQKGWIELNPDSTFCDRLVSIKDLPVLTELEVFPNPATNAIQFKVAQQGKMPLAIYNSLGVLVYKNDNYQSGETIKLTSFEAGVYFAQLDGARGRRFIVMR